MAILAGMEVQEGRSNLCVGSPFPNAPSQDAMETSVLCRVLPMKAVLLQCLHLQAAADYLGLFILLLAQELKKKEEIVDETTVTKISFLLAASGLIKGSVPWLCFASQPL